MYIIISDRRVCEVIYPRGQMKSCVSIPDLDVLGQPNTLAPGWPVALLLSKRRHNNEGVSAITVTAGSYIHFYCGDNIPRNGGRIIILHTRFTKITL